jgi:hypothetical protein
MKTAKKKAAAPKRRRRKAAAPAAHKRGGKFSIKVEVPYQLTLQGPELGALTATQRLELAELGAKKTSTVPVWADDKLWRRATREVRRHWRRYQYPYAAVAYVYLRMGGGILSGEHALHGQPRRLHPDALEHRVRRPSARRGSARTFERDRGAVHVERVRLDELGYDDSGTYYGLGEPLWRVTADDPYIDTVVRARTANDARLSAVS